MLIIMCKGNEVSKVKTQIYKVQGDMMVDYVTCGETRKYKKGQNNFYKQSWYLSWVWEY